MTEWMKGPLKGLFTNNPRQLAESTSVVLELIPVDINIALASDTVPINEGALTEAVAEWMDESFEEAVATVGYRYNFDQVILRQLVRRRRELQSLDDYVITYEGASMWNTDKELPTETTVYSIQMQVLQDASQGLVTKLQAQSDATGLGSAIVDAKGVMNHHVRPSAAGGGGDGGMSFIIVVAIVIAILASALLAFAMFMAYRARTGKEYIEGSHAPAEFEVQRTPGGGGNTAGPYAPDPMSQDISSSLSAYYKTGMAGGYKASRNQAGSLNDAASISSMESYGYSLDGYASSIVNA